MKALAVIGIILLVIIIVLAMTALYGWGIMLLVGVLWHEFGWLKPIGYWLSCGIGFLLSIVSGIFKQANSK